MADLSDGGISIEIFKDSLREFLKPIQKYLDDDRVSEIMINGPDDIFVEVKGKIIKTKAKFSSEPALLAAARNISQFVGKPISEEDPILDARLPDGSRICVVIPPCAKNGTTIAIRKFSKEKLGLKDLINFGSMSPDMARFLDICIKLKKNILVSGGTGSGKTTLVNILASRIPGHERTIIIEDTSELQVNSEHVVQFETKHADHDGNGEVTIRDLVKASLRLRPDRIIVGEVRGGEALELVQAMNTGHDGSMGTLHANNPTQGMNRLETLCMIADVGVPAHVIRSQISDAIHIIIQASRLRDGSRRTTHISECLGVDEHGRYILKDIFLFQKTATTKAGEIKGIHRPDDYQPSFVQEIKTSGVKFPLTMFDLKKEDTKKSA